MNLSRYCCSRSERQLLTSSTGFVGGSSDGRLRLHNPVLARMWGLPPESLAARPHVESVSTWSRPLHGDHPIWQRLRATITAIDNREPVVGRIERPVLIDAAVEREASHQRHPHPDAPVVVPDAVDVDDVRVLDAREGAALVEERRGRVTGGELAAQELERDVALE